MSNTINSINILVVSLTLLILYVCCGGAFTISFSINEKCITYNGWLFKLIELIFISNKL